MATRVNRKLLAVVGACTLVAIGIGGALTYTTLKSDPMRHIRRGDVEMANGDYRKAAGYYGRAIGMRPNSIEFHDKFLDATSKIVPDTANEAREKYFQWLGSVFKKAEILRTDADLWRAALDERRFQAELTDSVEAWKTLAESTRRIIDLAPPDDPVVGLANAYAGYAQSRRMQGLAPSEIVAAVTELEATIPTLKGPERDLAYGGLLTLKATPAIALQEAGQARQAADAWKEFDEVLARAKADEPDGVQVARAELVRAQAAREGKEPGAGDEQVDAAADRLAERAIAADDMSAAIDAAKAIGPGLVSARILRAYVDNHPDAILHRRALAYCLQFSDINAAEAEARKVVEYQQLPISLAGASQEEVRVLAAQQLFDLEYARASLSDEADLSAALDRLQKARDRVAELTTGMADDAILVKCDGKLALARDDQPTASIKFNELFKRNAYVDAELYSLAAINAMQMGEYGLALQRIENGLSYAPGNLDLLETRARLQFMIGRDLEGRRTLESVIARDPNRQSAKRLLARASEMSSDSIVPSLSDPIVRGLKDAEEAFTAARAARDAGQDDAAAKGFDKSRSILKPLLEAHPEDPRLFASLATVEAGAGNRELALDYITRGLKVAPNDDRLKRLGNMIASDDPVQRVIGIVAQNVPEGPDRIVNTYVRLAQVAESSAADAQARRDSGDDEGAARAADASTRLAAAATEWEKKAIEADAMHPLLLDHRFNNALKDSDFQAGEALLAQADKQTRDPSLPANFRARLALARQNPAGAVEAIQQSFSKNIESSDLYRLQGFAYDQMGDVTNAVKSYAEAYRRKPTDMTTVKLYVSELVRSGNRAGALTVLREARPVAGDDVEIGRMWIDLEAEIGDRRLARLARQSRWELTPRDRRNAIALASMLSEMTPERTDLVDRTTGQPRYTDQQWRGLDDARRSRELGDLRAQWLAQSEQIFDQLMAGDPTNIEVGLVRAGVYRRQGRAADGEAILRKVIAAAGDQADAKMWIGLGVHQAETGNLTGATDSFAKAIALQDDAKREADAAIGDYWFQREQWNRAAERFEHAAEKVQDRTLILRLCETYTRAGEFDKAREALKKAAAQNHDAIVDQLEASIESGTGDALRAQQKESEAIAAYARALTALQKAEAAVPNNPVPLVQEAEIQKKSYDLTGKQAQLDAALAAATRAVKLRGDYWPASESLSNLLVASGDEKAALVELERFIRAAPSVAAARRRLIETLSRMGNTGRAIEVTQEAITLSPNDPQWRIGLGEVYLLAGRLDDAIAAFVEADQLRPDPGTLHRLTDLRLRRSPPDFRGVLAGLRDRGDEVRNSPYLQSAIAAALYSNGDEKRALDAMREAYRFAKQAIKAGAARPSVLDSWYTNLQFIFPLTKPADAERFIGEVTEGRPDPRDQRWLAEWWVASGADGRSRAIETVNAALAADDGKDPFLTTRLLDMQGSLRYLDGDCKDAIASYEKALAIAPDDPGILNNYAFLCGDCLKDAAKGLVSAEKAVRLAPTRPEFLDTLGYLQGLSGRDDEAIETLIRALRLQQSASANTHLAEIYLRKGQKDEARQYLKAAGDLKPDPDTQKRINALIEQLDH